MHMSFYIFNIYDFYSEVNSEFDELLLERSILDLPAFRLTSNRPDKRNIQAPSENRNKPFQYILHLLEVSEKKIVELFIFGSL